MSDAKTKKRSQKLSEVIASQLMEEIRLRGWPVGESLGTESELMARYKVSRATIAEAARQVERYGAAVMRRGSGGGLVVTNTAHSALSRNISTFLELISVTFLEQYEAALVIESRAAILASQNIQSHQIQPLRDQVSNLADEEQNIGLHRKAWNLRLEIAKASGSKPVLLFMRSIGRILTNYVRPDLRTQYRNRDFEHRLVADMAAMVEAIIAGDACLAAGIAKKDVERREARARELSVAQPLLEGGPLRRETPNKLAEQVAYAIRDDIARRGWQTGERLGDEADLPERYGVSQWVFRQAVRILEPSGIVKVKRGQTGGLFIGDPSPDHTVETSVSYLKAYVSGGNIDLHQYIEMRREVFKAIANFAAKRGTRAERDELCAISEDPSPEVNLDPRADRFWLLLSEMGRNKILSLFGAILNAFLFESLGKNLVSEDNISRREIAGMVLKGDGPMAQRYMSSYLEVSPQPSMPQSV